MEYIQRWAGAYTIISCSYWGKQYKYILERDLGIGFDHVIFICRKGTASFFVSEDEFNKFGRQLVKNIEENNDYALSLLNKIKRNTDSIMNLMNNLDGKIPTKEEFKIFVKYYENHLSLHNFMKKTPDFFSEELKARLNDLFVDARKYSEPVYSKTESFFKSLAASISEKEGYNKDFLTALTQDDLENYLDSRKLPDEKTLKMRYDACALVFENGNETVITGERVDEIEKDLMGTGSDEVKGFSANKGKVKGICRIVLDPFSVSEFNKGEILVTGMTRPEFMHLVKKASAIVTDVGGALCHAAIISRELDKPCIIGTGNATKILKDGDLVEVDADKGIVKKW